MWPFLGAYSAGVLKGDANSGPYFPHREDKKNSNNNPLMMTRHELREYLLTVRDKAMSRHRQGQSRVIASGVNYSPDRPEIGRTEIRQGLNVATVIVVH